MTQAVTARRACVCTSARKYVRAVSVTVPVTFPKKTLHPCDGLLLLLFPQMTTLFNVYSDPELIFFPLLKLTPCIIIPSGF